jgi:hypothetical protein
MRLFLTGLPSRHDDTTHYKPWVNVAIPLKIGALPSLGLAIETTITICLILSPGLQVTRRLLARIASSSSSEAPCIDSAVARPVQQEGWRRIAKDKSQ